MGFQLPTNSPQFQAYLENVEKTFAIGIVKAESPVGGDIIQIGLFVKQPNGSWNSQASLKQYSNKGDLVADIHKAGGKVKYLQNLLASLKAFLTTIFGRQVPPNLDKEPATDEEAIAMLIQYISGLKVAIVDEAITVN